MRWIFLVAVPLLGACSSSVLEHAVTGSGGAPATTTAGGSGGCTSNADCALGDHCVAGQCACSADLATDPYNCGSCGNWCTSGACQAGNCVGTVLASGVAPGRLVVDETNVYWIDGTAAKGIKKVSVTGGTPVLLAEPVNPWRIAVDATHVYWTDSEHAVTKVPIAGGATTILSFNAHGGPLALAPPNVYWISRWDQEDVVCMAPLVPGPPGVTLYSNLPTRGRGMAADATNLYWSTRDSQTWTGAILKMPLGGGPVTTLVSGPYLPDDIALDATHVYWADEKVWKVPLSGGAPTTLAETPPGKFEPRCLVRDGSFIYGTTVDRIWRVPVDGAPAEIVLDNVNSAACIALDATLLYWSNPSNNAIVKIPK